jgi:selenocysteine lyase/cysteine desulfurase
VAFVGPDGHNYLDDPLAREEGGTPAIIESIRAGLVFALKRAVGTDLIQAREERFWRRARGAWDANPGIELGIKPGVAPDSPGGVSRSGGQAGPRAP